VDRDRPLFGGIGDAVLLIRGRLALGAGMVLLAMGHLSYLWSCAHRVEPSAWLTPFAAVPALLAVAALRWLWPYLGRFRVPTATYVALFATMVTAAWAPFVRGEGPRGAAVLLATGAMLFYLSDLAVARHRFVHESFWNKAWGIPLYLAGQLLIALSARSL
jgi:uncharacterized membrane protein YhhN